MPRGISQKTKQKRGLDRDAVKPGSPKRTAVEIDRDRADIARLYLEGKTQTEIAETLSQLRNYSLSQPTIVADLKVVRERWLSSAVEDYEQTKMIELARLDEEELIAKTAWEDSRKPRRKERTRTGTNDGKPYEEFMEESENRDGNPAFLARLESIRLRRCTILGFDAQHRSQNINAAIDTLLAAGYIVRLPEEKEEDRSGEG